MPYIAHMPLNNKPSAFQKRHPVSADEVRRALEASASGERYDNGVVVKDGIIDLTSGPGWVYFIVSGDDQAVKIGWSRNPHQRGATLQTGHIGALKFLGIIPGSRLEEAQLHRVCRKHRLNGEWFSFPPLEHVLVRAIRKHGFSPESDASAAKSRSIPEQRKTKKALALEKYKELGILGDDYEK